ncbi:helix-turn-helix domain-containing protein [Actinospica sp. MGRD01-02]|uniref:Helix-turn-helix domain-containing protein n=1 Tax=Actinospica acidithermotolerans TaxID=2828514 RepID=A0A941IPG7_9ACTN|nr:helix-turn-helix domain-containing protein [Actinospica acidithermotolerans]MBR7830411.1 helix-turn-helix domain-containing protein [Actinospica acidithermotolerans]
MPETESTTMTPSMNAMLAALSADRGASVTELSKRANLGRSTAARVLTTLEGMGLARRERPDRSADHSSPDLWFTATTDQFEPDDAGNRPADHTPKSQPETPSSGIPSPTDVDDPAPTMNSDPEGAADTADANDDDGNGGLSAQTNEESRPGAASGCQDPATPPDSDAHPGPEPDANPDPAVDGPATDPAHGPQRQAHDATADRPEPDADSAPGPGSATSVADSGNADAAAPSETRATVRLGKGELRAMVFEHLKAHPDEDFTAPQVAKALGKSSGAIANNFDALAKTGDAQMTCEKPRKFRFLAKAAK